MGDESLKDTWNVLVKMMPFLDSHQSSKNLDFVPVPEMEFNQCVNTLQKLNLTSHVQDLILKKVKDHARQQIAPNFWAHFKAPGNNDSFPSNSQFFAFHAAVEELYLEFTRLCPIFVIIGQMRLKTNAKSLIYGSKNEMSALKVLLRGTLLSQMPVDYQKVIQNFYESVLRLENLDDSINEDECFICTKQRHLCMCLDAFNIANSKMGELGILEPLAGHVLTNVVYNTIYMHINKTCKDSYDVSYINTFLKWINSIILQWLKQIYCSPGVEDYLESFEKKLINFFYNTYTKIRIDQLFNIIIEYPESLPALEDLRQCLPKTDLKNVLTKKLQKALEKRLLHPGVSTGDVLTAYTAAIRSLRVLDPSGLLLEVVTQPIHQFLKSRDDTIRCVVSSLTEEGPCDLSEELIRGEAVDQNAEEKEENWETWTPDPVEASSSKSTSTKRTSDIISMLVNVYGSKELFVNEYRTLLADRLLSNYTCDTEKEIRYIELLKLRFGESHLHYCEVMLKDVVDSKRINQHISQDEAYLTDTKAVSETTPLSALIVSSQFWPVFKEEKLDLHPSLAEQMKKYTNSFETLKGKRTLCWKNHLGVVDLEIEIGDRTLNLSVSPLLATIMMHFKDQGTWNLEDLSKVMQVPPTILKRKLSFWKSHGLITESDGNIFRLEEDNHKYSNSQEDVLVEDYESESAMASTQDQRAEELQTFWSYIVGMLMNLDSLSLERIHQMLKMFAFQGASIECSVQELKVFLDRKVRDHHLLYTNGFYKLPK